MRRLTRHRRFGEIVVGPRAAVTPGRRCLRIWAETPGAVGAAEHIRLKNCDLIFDKWPPRAGRMFEAEESKKG